MLLPSNVLYSTVKNIVFSDAVKDSKKYKLDDSMTMQENIMIQLISLIIIVIEITIFQQ